MVSKKQLSRAIVGPAQLPVLSRRLLDVDLDTLGLDLLCLGQSQHQHADSLSIASRSESISRIGSHRTMLPAILTYLLSDELPELMVHSTQVLIFQRQPKLARRSSASRIAPFC